LKTFEYTCHDESIFFFFGLKLCTNVKNKCEKRTFGHFFFWEKKSLDMQKIKNHVVTSLY